MDSTVKYDGMTCNQLIGAKIKKLRLESGLSQQEVEDAVGVSDRHLYEYEKGDKSFDTDLLFKLAELFDVSIFYLLSDYADDYFNDMRASMMYKYYMGLPE